MRYTIYPGNNLVSYPGTQPEASINNLSGKQDIIVGVIGQGVAIAWNDTLNSWVGNLNQFEPGKSYWIKTNSSTEFSFTQSQNALSGESTTHLNLNVSLTPESSIDEIYSGISRQIRNQVRSKQYIQYRHMQVFEEGRNRR